MSDERRVPKEEIPKGGLEPSPGAEVVTLSMGWIWLEDDGVLRAKLRPNLHVTAEQMLELLGGYREIGGGRPVAALVDFHNLRRGNNAVRRVMASPESAALHVGAAFLVRSPVGRVLANAFMRLQRPPSPTKAFAIDAIPEALAWLHSLSDAVRSS